WWSWPLNLYPVWYFVDYGKNTIANIFASGNPALFWSGVIAVILTIREVILKKSLNLLIILLGFFSFWLPWSISPRIMFLYHFSPSVPFLSLALGYQLNKLLESSERKKLAITILVLIILAFVLIFPFLTAVPIPRDFVKVFFMTNLSKNIF
ncbi:phospholipid carrier-dependent glycosyltransferase, partial [Candidatus Daviesbacteria bacterium]|nr:phospholipid carrier-dependent glycosyltransferase [Candidatus Daviesbacteria bacterium]